MTARRVRIFSTVLLVVSLLAAPGAAAQLGQWSCARCTKICWTGLFLIKSCEYFCVEAGQEVGYDECYAGTDWCQQIDKCVWQVV